MSEICEMLESMIEVSISEAKVLISRLERDSVGLKRPTVIENYERRITLAKGRLYAYEDMLAFIKAMKEAK